MAALLLLTAGAGARVHVTGASIVGANADAFVIASDACAGQTLRAGQTCTVGVRFAPGEQGPRSAALQIADDAPNAPQTVRLSGTGGGPPGGETGAAGPAGPPGPSAFTVTPARAARPFTGRAARRRPGSVTMRGTIDTMGETVTWQFEYGRHRPYEQATPVRTITAGHGRTRVSWRLRDLPPNATFHYRLVARVSPGAVRVAGLDFMARFDFLVLPVVQVPPFDIDQEYVTEIEGQRLKHPQVPRRHLDNYLLPEFGDRVPAEITPAVPPAYSPKSASAPRPPPMICSDSCGACFDSVCGGICCRLTRSRTLISRTPVDRSGSGDVR